MSCNPTPTSFCRFRNWGPKTLTQLRKVVGSRIGVRMSLLVFSSLWHSSPPAPFPHPWPGANPSLSIVVSLPSSPVRSSHWPILAHSCCHGTYSSHRNPFPLDSARTCSFLLFPGKPPSIHFFAFLPICLFWTQLPMYSTRKSSLILPSVVGWPSSAAITTPPTSLSTKLSSVSYFTVSPTGLRTPWGTMTWPVPAWQVIQ